MQPPGPVLDTYTLKSGTAKGVLFLRNSAALGSSRASPFIMRDVQCKQRCHNRFHILTNERTFIKIRAAEFEVHEL